MTFKFTVPDRYDLKQIILGQSVTSTGVLVPVASSYAIGSFPEWISEYNYAAVGTYYYGIKWKYDNGTYSTWSNKMMGKTGIDKDYIIINAPSVSSVYIMNPVSGDIAAPRSSWLEFNKEYYITVKKSLSGTLTYGMESEYQLTFTSKYCPLFSSVDNIRFEAGGFINNLSDDTINRIIHKNSSYIMNRYISLKGSFPSGYYTCGGELLNNAFQRYVQCKSALDSITAVELSIGANSSKKLGDMQISYGGIDVKKDPFSKKQELKECTDAALNIIFSQDMFKISERGKYYTKIKHPMNDSTYGRLSLTQNIFDSKFDELRKVI